MLQLNNNLMLQLREPVDVLLCELSDSIISTVTLGTEGNGTLTLSLLHCIKCLS